MSFYKRRSMLHVIPLLALVALVAGLKPVGATQPQEFVSQIPGFPVNLPSSSINFGSPTIADINVDGKPEIVAGGNDGVISAVSSSGQLLWQFHTDAAINSLSGITHPTGTAIRSAPAVGDIDGDGQPEIVVSVGDVFQAKQNGGVVALHNNGTLVKGWPQLTMDMGGNGSDLGSPDGYTDGVASSPSIADLFGDGQKEIIYGAFDQHVYVKRADGSDLPGWPKFVRDTVWSSPAVADLFGDGRKEIIIGIDAHADPYYGDLNGGYVKVYFPDGTEVPGWPQHRENPVYSSPAVGDLLGNGQNEIVVGSSGFNGLGKQVTAYRPDGTTLWESTTVTPVGASPVLAHLRSTTLIDAAVMSDQGYLYAWDGRTGALLPGYPIQPRSIYGPEGTGGLVAGDYDGDGLDDLFASDGSQVAVIRGKDAFQLTASTNPPGALPAYDANSTLNNTPALGDLNGDGKLELVAGAANAGIPQGRISAWELPASSGATSWPLFRHDLPHTGVYTPPRLVTSTSQLASVLLKGTRTTINVAITSADGSVLQWTATDNDPNQIVTITTKGSTPGTLNVTLSAPSTPGTYQASITLQAPGVPNVTIPVTVYSATQVHSVYTPVIMH
ncbi:MAG: VCBS repeat-containing protein [Herpetosiphonaceae bacterium]|nr:VCBS repeat-containing protein [Herpetosiphonaceae bacterium]